jgi:mannose-6-phosphate isomerase-like protein (cupin superfamily)
MTVIRAADAPRFELPGVEFTGYATPSRGGAEVCTWRITVAPGFVSDQSHTLDRAEVFMLTRGRLQITADGEPLEPGDTAVVPAGAPIFVANPGGEPAEAIVAIGAGFRAKMADGTVVDTPPWAA